MKVDCVILAAGLSSRTGTNKLALEIGGETVIGRCMGAFHEYCSRVIVVTGRYHEDIKRCLAGYPKVHFVYNEDYHQGMFSSVKTGIRQVKAERFFITPGDYPLIKNDTIIRMLNTPGRFVAPVYESRQGHPVLLDKLLIPSILGSNSTSLREFLHDISAAKVHVDDIGVITDIDTMEQFNEISSFIETHPGANGIVLT